MTRRWVLIQAESWGSFSLARPMTELRVAARVRRKVENSADPARCMSVMRVHRVLAERLPLGQRVAPACPA